MNSNPPHKFIFDDFKMVILAVLTLGLAPYYPEPHILGKVRWVLGGAVGMSPMDYFDMIYHGIPFILLTRLIIKRLMQKKNKPAEA